MTELEEEKSGKKTVKLIAEPPKIEDGEQVEKLAQNYQANRAELSDSLLQIRAQVNAVNIKELKDMDIQNKEENTMPNNKYKNIEKKANDNVANRAELNDPKESFDNKQNKQEFEDAEDKQ